MKNLLIILFFSLLFSCSKEIVTVKDSASNIPLNTDYFKGNLIGEDLNFVAFQNEVSPASGKSFYTKNDSFSETEQDYFVCNFGVQKVNASIPTLVQLSCAFDMKDYENYVLIRNYLRVGKKIYDFNPEIWFGKEHYKGFSFRVTYKNQITQKVTVYSSVYGSQEGSSLEVVEQKEILAPKIPGSTTPQMTGIYVKFKLNCKLYDVLGIYRGDLKDAELAGSLYDMPKLR